MSQFVFILAGSAFLMIGGGVYKLYRMVRYTEDAWEAARFGVPVAAGYMPFMRLKTKKWPTNLSGLPKYCASGVWQLGSAPETTLKVYRESFEGMKVLKSDLNSCQFRLDLKRYTVTCNSWVHPEGGDCTYAEK
jgi:hypothetical protein